MGYRARCCATVLSACLCAALMLFSSFLMVQAFKNSGFYRQSKIIGLLVSRDSVGVRGLFEDSRNLDTMLKFTGALTSAYINFELIPVNEVDTFVVVLESLPENVVIEKFEYQRRNLIIEGSAANRSGYFEFLHNLREHEHFKNISEHSYLTTENSVHFELTCSIRYADGTRLNLS